MTPKRILILAAMFLLVTGSLLPELAADRLSGKNNKEAKTNIAVGKGTSVNLITDDYISVSCVNIYTYRKKLYTR